MAATPPHSETDWQKFMLAEGLDVLATYRVISSPTVRRIILRLIAMAAEVEQGGRIAELDEEFSLLVDALTYAQDGRGGAKVAN